MAPKKNRIKVEQEPQGSSTPPSKPGATTTRRQTQKKPKKLRRVRVLGQITKLQKSAELYTPFAPFVRLVKEITDSCSSQVKHWTPEALLWLQDAADFYLNESFYVELQLAIYPIFASSSAGKYRGEEHAGGSP